MAVLLSVLAFGGAFDLRYEAVGVAADERLIDARDHAAAACAPVVVDARDCAEGVGAAAVIDMKTPIGIVIIFR